jgi:hypothetical protein
LAQKPEAKRPLGKHRHSWEHDIEINLNEVDLEVMELIEMLPNRDQWPALDKMVKNVCIPSISGKFWAS